VTKVGLSQLEKDAFLNASQHLIEGSDCFLGGYLNVYFGQESDGYEKEYRECGFGTRHVEDEILLEFGDLLEMVVCGTQFKGR
jgi:hypothetical protein